MLAWNFVVLLRSENFYKTLVSKTSVSCEALSSVMLSVFRVTSLCHTVTLVSRCLPVPGVSRTECHSPGPRSARSVSPGPALAVRVWHCSVPGQPPSHCGHVTSSWHGRHQTLASQHRPARAMAASLPRQALLCSSQVQALHPWSHPAIPDPPWSLVTITVIRWYPPQPTFPHRQDFFIFPECHLSQFSVTVTRLASESHNVSSWLHIVCVMIASVRNATHACFDA